LLVSAKLLNVGVPFLFKHAVDLLNTHLDSPLHLGDPQTAIATTVFSVLVACEYLIAFTLSGLCV
jgi:hypothetical protein